MMGYTNYWKSQGSSLNLDVPAEFEQAKDFGFATMLSNLLENAFIAVCKVPDSKERKVSVSLQMSARRRSGADGKFLRFI